MLRRQRRWRLTGARQLHGAHESAFSVVKDVAVVHPRARSIVEADDDRHAVLERDAHGVLPLQRPSGFPVLVQDLEKEAVEVQRV